MRRCRISPAKAIVFLLIAGRAFAHQPRFVDGRPLIEVRHPEISQAFYARLAGNPQMYRIRSETPLRLYVNILVPDLPGIEADYEAVISRQADPRDPILARLDGKACEWRPFYEPFGGDHYMLGPEFDEQVLAGAAGARPERSRVPSPLRPELV